MKIKNTLVVTISAIETASVLHFVESEEINVEENVRKEGLGSRRLE